MPVIGQQTIAQSAPAGTPGQILNPTALSPFNPDFPVPIPPLPDPDEIQMRSGEVFLRYNNLAGREFDLVWGSVLQSTADALRQWAAQYRDSYFSYYDVQRDRYYTGRFKGGMQVIDLAFNRCAVKATFQELPGLPMPVYPQNWARDAVLLPMMGAWGYKVQLAGAWAYATDGSTKSGQHLLSNSAGAKCTFQYFGYGFRAWMVTGYNYGNVTIFGDGNNLGTVDLYSAAITYQVCALVVPSAVLGLHTIDFVVTGTKNGASSDFYVAIDCIEVMV